MVGFWIKLIPDQHLKYHSPSLASFTSYATPLALDRGDMQYVWDIHGDRYIDCTGENGSISIGHAHPFVIEEAKKQIDTIPHVSTAYYNAVPVEYARELIEKMPPCPDTPEGKSDSWIVHLVNSGAYG